MHPTIWATKMLLARLQGRAVPAGSAPAAAAAIGPGEEQKTAPVAASSPAVEEDVLLSPREVVMFADLHGHSRAPNVFLYGVAGAAAAEEAQQQQPMMSPAASPRSSPSLSPAASPSPPPASASSSHRKSFPAHRLSERVFPRLLSLRSPFFDLGSCNFTVRKSKETTARVVVARELGIANSFTIEASFGGVVSTPPPPPTTVTAAADSNGASGSSPSPSASLSRGVMSSSSPSLCLSPSPSPSPPPAAVSIPIVNPLHNSRYQGFQFTTRMYEEMGWNICSALVDYADPSCYAQARAELEAMYPAAAAPSVKARDSHTGAESNVANGPAEDSDDDEVDPTSATVELEVALRSKLRVSAGLRKKKKKARASTATRAAATAAGDRPESKEAPGSGGGKKKHRARSKSGERKRRPSDAGASAASSSSSARAHSASLLPAALHVKRLLERLEAESAAAAGAGASGVAGSDVELSEGGDLSDTGVQPSASAPDLLEAMLMQRGAQPADASVKLVKSASRVRMSAAPASFDSASYVAPSSLLLTDLPLVAAAKPRRPSGKKVGLKKKKSKSASSAAAAGSSKAS